MRRNASARVWSNQNRPDWHFAGELLRTNQYEQLAEFFRTLEAAFKDQADSFPVQVVTLALRLCLACSESQAEAGWHRQAERRAAHREQHLRQQIQAALDLLGEYDPSSMSEWQTPSADFAAAPVSPSESPSPIAPERPGLWQHIRNVFRRSTALSLPGRAVPAPGDEERARRHSPEVLTAPEPVVGPEAGAFLPDKTETGTLSPTGQQVADTGPATQPDRAPSEQAAPAGQTEPPAPLEPAELEAPPELVPLQVAEAKKGKVDSAVQREQPELPPTRVSTPPAMVFPVSRDVPSLLVYCLGPFQVYQDEQAVFDWPSSKGKSVFKYLLTHRERPVSKEVLMELFWPDAQPDAARNNLNVAIYGLRQALREGRPTFSHVLFKEDCYLLNPKLHIWIDVEEFEMRCRIGTDLEQQARSAEAMREYRAAEALYQGEFLEEDRYEDWVVPLRHRLQTGFLAVLDRLSRYDLDREDYASCAAVCRKMLVVDGCSEEAHRRLMRCYSRQGQPYLGLRQYHLCVQALSEELEVAPSSATAELYQRIRNHQPI